jgi:hypothetical protein
VTARPGSGSQEHKVTRDRSAGGGACGPVAVREGMEIQRGRNHDMTPQAERNCVLEVVEQPCVGFAMNRDNVDTALEISGRVIAFR